MKKYILLLLVFLTTTVSLSAQEGVPFYLDYLLDNEALMHPSTVGVTRSGKLKATIRGQWFELDRAPLLQTINTNIRLKGPSGMGVMAYSDRNGYHSQVGGQISYAYHISLVPRVSDVEILSFGISAGAYQRIIDETKFISKVPDPSVTGQTVSASTANIDVGVSYRLFEYYAHFTIKNILVGGDSLYENQGITKVKRYMLTTGYTFGKGKVYYDASASILVSEQSAENLLDLNGRVFFEIGNANKTNQFFRLWIGPSFRKGFGADLNRQVSLLSGVLGMDYRGFTLGYIYSHPIVSNYTGGLHQAMIGLGFLKKREPYKCKCPSLH